RKEVGRGYLGAKVLRHRYHIESIAVAGQIHHLELRSRERRAVTLEPGKENRVQELLGLQQRTDINVQIERMDAQSLRGGSELLMETPVVIDGLGECDHRLDDLDLVFHIHPLRARHLHHTIPQRLQELISLFSQKLDAVCG